MAQFLGSKIAKNGDFGRKWDRSFLQNAKTTTSALLANFEEKVRVGTGTFAIFRPNVAAYDVIKNSTFFRRDFRDFSPKSLNSGAGEISELPLVIKCPKRHLAPEHGPKVPLRTLLAKF